MAPLVYLIFSTSLVNSSCKIIEINKMIFKPILVKLIMISKSRFIIFKSKLFNLSIKEIFSSNK